MNILLVRNEFIKKHHYTDDYSQLSNSLKKLGHKVSLIGLDDKNKFEKDLLLLKIPFNKRRYFLLELSLLLPIYCLIKKIKVVIVSNGIIPGTIILILLKKYFLLKLFLMLDLYLLKRIYDGTINTHAELHINGMMGLHLSLEVLRTLLSNTLT